MSQLHEKAKNRKIVYHSVEIVLDPLCQMCFVKHGRYVSEDKALKA